MKFTTMEFLSEILNALPDVASSLLAFVGYLATIISWGLAIYRNNRLNLLLERLPNIPESQRVEVVEAELLVLMPKKLTAEQWIPSNKRRYFSFAYAVSILTLFVIIAMSALNASINL